MQSSGVTGLLWGADVTIVLAEEENKEGKETEKSFKLEDKQAVRFAILSLMQFGASRHTMAQDNLSFPEGFLCRHYQPPRA